MEAGRQVVDSMVSLLYSGDTQRYTQCVHTCTHVHTTARSSSHFYPNLQQKPVLVFAWNETDEITIGLFFYKITFLFCSLYITESFTKENILKSCFVDTVPSRITGTLGKNEQKKENVLFITVTVHWKHEKSKNLR